MPENKKSAAAKHHAVCAGHADYEVQEHSYDGTDERAEGHSQSAEPDGSEYAAYKVYYPFTQWRNEHSPLLAGGKPNCGVGHKGEPNELRNNKDCCENKCVDCVIITDPDVQKGKHCEEQR